LSIVRYSKKQKNRTFRKLDLFTSSGEEAGDIYKSKMAQHACEEGHRVGLDEARVLEIESNSTYRKYKESAHMACLTNPISQPSLDISPLWIPLISKDVSKSKGKLV
jgi:hypothetical protein